MKKDFIIRQEQRQPLRQLYMWLKSLQSTLVFMQTGAHPDDETSRMLARLSLGDGMHVVYVNAVRGQGGQNALGPERGDALGYLRTEELFEAMRVIRADIAWLAESPNDPIRDFGFSKSGEQTFEHWGREHSLRQMVKMVRLFKPDILIPTFLDVPGQHGHHRAVTQTTIAAFDDAADETKFADLGLAAWQVNTLYCRHGAAAAVPMMTKSRLQTRRMRSVLVRLTQCWGELMPRLANGLAPVTPPRAWAVMWMRRNGRFRCTSFAQQPERQFQLD